MRDELASHSLKELAAQVAAKAPDGFNREIADWLEQRTLNRRGDHPSQTLES
jgi:hypothetical protein